MKAAGKIDVERAITTLQIVLSGGQSSDVSDLAEALVLVGRMTETIFASLARSGHRDVAVSYVRELQAALDRIEAEPKIETNSI